MAAGAAGRHHGRRGERSQPGRAGCRRTGSSRTLPRDIRVWHIDLFATAARVRWDGFGIPASSRFRIGQVPEETMTRSIMIAGLTLAGLAVSLFAHGFEQPIVHAPESIVYQPTPYIPEIGVAVLSGSTKEGPYTFRAHLPAGLKLPAHTHPDTRTVTVISGVYYFAAGDSFDESTIRGYGPGTVIVVPGGTPHFSWARDGDVFVQESGIGPTTHVPTGR